ncbi:hypothetical protein QAD02_016988 [Eretmocerus hayati]|uniref:Uncharacterized protein n=1 Tax=Eretmocerus hayati TaxID=131215 RepID=A0ACC2PCL6_9HYME|nr:hypothetical protein QAD02_016988 [Eretmocerus hayati]
MSNETGGWNLTCGSGVDGFHTFYVPIHGWAALVVCVYGLIANGLNIAVLTRREMRSPTNTILTGLAVADMLVMLDYIPYAVHSYLYHRSKRERYSYAWAVFVLFHSFFSQVFHTISICLTVTLAVWRYIAVAHPQKNREWCSQPRTKWAIAAAYFICPIICIPGYIATEVTSRSVILDSDDHEVNVSVLVASGVTNLVSLEPNATLYLVSQTKSSQNDGFMDIYMWIYSLVIKLIPCIALTILSLRLIKALIDAKKRRKKLTSTTMLKMEESVSVSEGKKRKRRASRMMDKEKQTDRTTKMLLAVLLLFLLTEFPQGTLGLLSLWSQDFFRTCYVKLGKDGYMCDAFTALSFCARTKSLF